MQNNMEDVLTKIVAHKRIEVAEQKALLSEVDLEKQLQPRIAYSFKAALNNSPSGIISEFKRKSPSKGWIKQGANPKEIVPGYEKNGAAALSILTDEHFFGGTLADIEAVRSLVQIPILRKDFIIDRYQLLQAQKVGADVVLLIAACLTKEECAYLTNEAHKLGLEVLLEVHSVNELEYITPEIDVVGCNNRNLGTFVTDIQNSFNLAKALQGSGKTMVSESGISKVETIKELREVGFRGFLIGETFMKEACPPDVLRQYTAEF